jgi:succinyl-CoA synthetase alpha subunit
MAEFGTNVTAGIAPGRGGTRVQEVIPVYDSVRDALDEHPGIAVASIWRHYSTAKDAALEVIEAGIPIIVLISEGIPLRDVRDILVAARKHNTLLLGGNTPGIIFPPEGVKVGMLPDVFHPEEVSDGRAGSHGVTILSRSGAILYHLSDALASAGIAQNAVIGIGGDGAIGSRFIDLVSLVMGYENTDVVVIAGEIGGAQEEILAQDIKQHPEKYPKPLIALISGANAPEGKTMGHAGAVVAPGQAYGTHASKKTALEEVGVEVVNNQHDLVKMVQEKVGGEKYFEIDRYYERMREKWEQKPPKPSWGTLITKVEPNNLMISGYPLQELVEKKSLLEIAYLLVKGELPDPKDLQECQKIAIVGARESAESLFVSAQEDISQSLAKYLLVDDKLAKFADSGKDGPIRKMMFCLGRVGRYFASILGTEKVLDAINENDPFSHVIFRTLTGQEKVDQAKADILEAMVSASVDHGVTPPSAQATLIAASTRASYEVGVASGVGAITDVHGGAGAKAAEFFLKSLERAEKENLSVEDAVYTLMKEYIAVGRRIEGMGHRIHTKDPRRDILWKRAESSGLAKGCVEVSKIVTDTFEKVRGMYLPINVDGVIGAIVADLGLDPSLAKAVFVWGRVAGLSSHYYEEIASQPQMRRIVFGDAIYKGKGPRSVPS